MTSSILVRQTPLLRRSLQISDLRSTTVKRTVYYKFTRKYFPPQQKPKESPYVVGPYLKPDYLPIEYTTEPLKSRHYNDYNLFIYRPEKVEPDEKRTVRLLLLKDVEGLGIAGQTVDAPFRAGASRLVAMQKAEYATDFAYSWYKFGQRSAQSASTALSPKTARLLKKDIFNLPACNLVKVEPWHLSLALRLSGCICPIQAIEKESIVETTIVNEEGQEENTVECTVRINNHERVQVKFRRLGNT